MRAGLIVSALWLGLLAPLTASAQTAKPSLAIIGAGVQAEPEAPFVSLAYRFLPGDYVYFTFQIAGFKIAEKEDAYAEKIRRISLSYKVWPEDAAGRPLVAPATGTIAEFLHPQDKDWIPKRRASFLLPSFLAAGVYRIHVSVEDALGKTQTSLDVPFTIGGTEIKSSPFITVQNFRFYRGAQDAKPLAVPAYSPGDPVFVRFDIAGYQLGPKNTYDVSYGLTVLGPDGKPFIQQPKAAELKAGGFYPAQFVPASLSLTTNRKSARGAYVVVLQAKDLISGKSCELKQAFTLE